MKDDFKKGYKQLVKRRIRTYGKTEGAIRSVGAEFSGAGQLMLLLLRNRGLRPEDVVVELGCGAGRLAKHLAGYLTSGFKGYDIIPELVRHARTLTDRRDFEFIVSDGKSLPLPAGAADWVCAFSVFTHLLPEHCYLYLQEMKRVLKPGGNAVVTFLDIDLPAHWPLFEESCRDVFKPTPLNTFLCRSFFVQWLRRLDLELVGFWDADERFFGHHTTITLDSGEIQQGPFPLGQSLCHFRRRT